MPERVQKFQGQCYHRLKRLCVRRGVLFQDPLFPPKGNSLFYQRPLPLGLMWKRPGELCNDPRLFVDGISTRDLHQGSLGNCWMVAAMSCLASEASLWRKVIPKHQEQEWNPKRLDLYAGIFHFRFWRLGRWMDVVIDDRLPVGEDGCLLFCRSSTPREFWSALLEKAYAKLNGCYEALEGGNTVEALVDFTGGVCECLNLDRELFIQQPDKRRELFLTLSQAHGHHALISCSIRPPEGEKVESVLDCGLVQGHAYGITGLRTARFGQQLLGRPGHVHMVRMKNPWGSADWKGTWSQGSLQWQLVSGSEREKMGFRVRDGEFWMDFKDFCHYFTDVVLCQQPEQPNTHTLVWPHQRWTETHCPGQWSSVLEESGGASVCLTVKNKDITSWEIHGNQKGKRKEKLLRESGGKVGEHRTEKINDMAIQETSERLWDSRSRCGGCINHRDTFLLNPQFLFEVQHHQQELLICLQQEDRRHHRREGAGQNLPIGFEVLRVEENRVNRVHSVGEQAASSVYMDSRSVSLRVTLPAGRYVLLPTTFQPGVTGRFLLRLLSHSKLQLKELKEDLPRHSSWRFFSPQPCLVTTVHLQRACGLTLHKGQSVYAIIHCEEKEVRTRVFKQDSNPEFNIKAIFYRSHPETYICIELWLHGWIWNTLLGVAQLQTSESERGHKQVLELQDGRSRPERCGCVYVVTSSSTCLTDL